MASRFNRDNIKVAEEKMKEINVAYTTLSDEVARIDYNKKLDAESKKSSSRTGATSSAQSETPRTSRKTTAGNSSAKIDFQNMQSSFESFFGFNPHTKEVTNEDKLNTYASDRKKKNPLDTTDFFEKFMGFKI